MVVEQPELADTEILFERDSGWNQDESAFKSKLQRELSLLRDDLLTVQIMYSPKSSVLVKFGREFIFENEAAVKNVVTL